MDDQARVSLPCSVYSLCRAGARFNLFTVKGVEIAFFAGVWRPWKGERLAEQPGKKRRAREEREWELYAFLTTEANDLVRPVHEKAMPVILTDPKECKAWLGGGVESLEQLQRPYPPQSMETRSAKS
ncbi:SOS response-associated peptidase family protein [Hyphococcus sp. DH-69]|uniref:SOS response-associated peptidase family protein n=1 Tax=Hyphococcus formosus TaxID=3143534 RepID=UPI00398A649C